MSNCIDKVPRTQVERLRWRFGQSEGLPFREVLSTGRVEQAIAEEVEGYRHRVYPPMEGSPSFSSERRRLTG